MIDLANHPCFTSLAPADVTLHVLSRRVAPLQQSFYFVNDGFSADGRFLWFYCAFPPSGSANAGRTLGVVDFEHGEVRHFPETQFSHAAPWVEPQTGAACWAQGLHTWRRAPEPDAPVEHVNAVPADLIGNRSVQRAATHLTRSADGRALFIDLGLETQYLFGSLPLDGGDFELWHRFDRNFNHAQFSPTDPDLVLFAQENHPDPLTGLTFPITNRLWLIRRGQAPRPIFEKPTRVSHEWWDLDGAHAWCVAGHETWRVRIADGATETIPLPHHAWHAHASRDGRLLVNDTHEGFYRGCASSVHFLNRQTGKRLTLAHNPARDDHIGRHYHIDPHPRFCCGDRYVVFTTTVRGEIDLAIVPVSELLDRTA